VVTVRFLMGTTLACFAVTGLSLSERANPGRLEQERNEHEPMKKKAKKKQAITLHP
jgi:hypothetical protein